jgi:hypothetical protein
MLRLLSDGVVCGVKMRMMVVKAMRLLKNESSAMKLE